MAYLRQQRALFAVAGVAAGAALFVDTKARSAHALMPARLLPRLRAVIRDCEQRRCSARACLGSGGVLATGILALQSMRRLCLRADACAPQRVVLRTAADSAEGWVSPPPPSKPLPVRAAARRRALASAHSPCRPQPAPPLLSAAHRAQLARSWNNGAQLPAAALRRCAAQRSSAYRIRDSRLSRATTHALRSRRLPRRRRGRRVRLRDQGA
jgi:hypothetical protein